MRYLINKPNFKELLRCLSIANIGLYVKYLGNALLWGIIRLSIG